MRNSEKPLPSHLEHFLDWLDIEKGLAPRSQKNYAQFLRKFFLWLRNEGLEKMKPQELTLEDVRRYRAYLSRHESLKRSTQNYYLIALRSLLAYFTEHDITSLPAEKIKLAREKEDKEVRFLSREQLEKFFEVPDTMKFSGVRDRAILEVLFSTGLRIAELVALDRREIQFPKDLSDELEIVVMGKGGRVRTVYFSERSLRALKHYLDQRADVDEALFVSRRNEKKKHVVQRISPRTIQEFFKKYAAQAGIPLNTTPHVMRHSLASDFVAQGIDIRTIQEFLGHKNIAATQIYTHVTKRQLKDIHKRIHTDSDE